jgi:curli biogenesis system outer membrane secretion channel CsgG
MTHVSRALLLVATIASGSAAQPPSRGAPGTAVKIAVVEFTPAADAAGMTPNAKRWLQAQLSATLHDTRRFDVYDTRHTRNASQGTLSAVNHDSSTAAAVAVGRRLGVRYVLTGAVTQYAAQGDGGVGHTTLRTRLVDVATGRVHHSGETVQKGTGVMRTAGEAEMHAKVMKPAIDALTATLLTTLPAPP